MTQLVMWLLTWPKNGRGGFLISYALSNAAYQVALRGPVAELDGGMLKHRRPGAFDVDCTGPVRVKGTSERSWSLLEFNY